VCRPGLYLGEAILQAQVLSPIDHERVVQ
jgi:hypothetical protein